MGLCHLGGVVHLGTYLSSYGDRDQDGFFLVNIPTTNPENADPHRSPVLVRYLYAIEYHLDQRFQPAQYKSGFNFPNLRISQRHTSFSEILFVREPLTSDKIERG